MRCLTLSVLCLLVAACGNRPDVELSPSSLPSGIVGTPYRVEFEGSGGEGEIDFRLQGRIPAGLSFWTGNHKAYVTGTPLEAGTFPIQVSATDGADTAINDYKLVIAALAGPPLTIDTVTLFDGTVGQGYNAAVTASGGTSTGYAWVVDSGALPAGLTLVAGTPFATITGTPTLPGNSSFVLRVTDSAGATATQPYSMSIDGDINIQPPFPLPVPSVGAAYSMTLTGTGGSGTYTWSISAGMLPPGLTLAATGTPATDITGTPTAGGRYLFTVLVQGSISGAGSLAFDITVSGGLQITTTSLPSGTAGTGYFATVDSSGGSGGPYTWSIIAGALPAGISLTGSISQGSLSGTPSGAGTFNFTVRVQDSASGTAQAPLSIVVSTSMLSIVTTSLPAAPPGFPYVASITGSGGTGAGYQWSIISGVLPAGVSLTATGTPSATVSGTPTQTGTFPITVRLQDSASGSTTQALSLRIYAPGEIWTVAGTGTSGFNGDGIQATQAHLNAPAGVAVSSTGLVYIADTQNHRIRVVNMATGVISTFAGTGSATYSADGIPAAASALNQPRDVALDAAGNVYVADSGNHRVRMIDVSTGLISTIAGNGTADYLGDGGQATSASLNFPQSVCIDSTGNVFIADSDNFVIRRVSATTGNISTFAGNNTNVHSGDGGQATAAGIGYPSAVAVDAADNLYIGETFYYVRRVVPASGVITTIAGVTGGGSGGDGGPASSAPFVFVSSLFIDGAGNIYVGDGGRIRRIDAGSGIINTVAGTVSGGVPDDGVPATSAALPYTVDAAVDAQGRIWVTTSAGALLRAVVGP